MTELDVINALAASGSQAVTAYTNYYFVNAIVWMAFAVGLLFLILKTWPQPRFDLDEPETIIKWLGIIIAAMIFVSNIPDLFSPQAYGIHQLIKDIRG